MNSSYETFVAKHDPPFNPESLPSYLRPAKIQNDREIRVQPGTALNRRAWNDYVAQSDSSES